jgi:hypothetical protein
MGDNTFTRRAARYGVGTSSRGDRPHGLSAVVLDRVFVEELTAGLPDDEESEACEGSEAVRDAQRGSALMALGCCTPATFERWALEANYRLRNTPEELEEFRVLVNELLAAGRVSMEGQGDSALYRRDGP